MRSTIYWLSSCLVSLVALLLILAMWSETARVKPPAFTIVDTPADLQSYLDEKSTEGKNTQFTGDPPYLLPTGFFIQSMSFVSAANVNINGYVWQKYPAGYPYQKGIDFPEEIFSDATTLREAYRDEVVEDGKTYELIGWYFDVTVRQTFDYRRYPLDFLTIWLRVWPAEFGHDDEIVLVPDFASYLRTDQDRFGLDEDIVSGEWSIDESFFSYHDVHYDTAFGYDVDSRGMTAPETYSEFYFNIGASRKFINAFIINLVPLFVVALLLFSALMMISNDEKQSSRFGFSTSSLVGTCSALFFVVMLSHIQVRSNFPGAGLVYIEYFYLVMYMAILLTAVDAYLVSIGYFANWWLIRWRDNLLPKLLFWPSLLWSMVIVSYLLL